MSTFKKIVHFSLFVGLFLSLSFKQERDSGESSTLSMGISKMNITPATPVRMSGYGGRTEPFSGIHDSLYLTAMVFSDGMTTAALVTSDLIGLSVDFCNETMVMIEKEAGIDRKNILLSATHTHGGPRTRVYNDNLASHEYKYVKGLQQKIVSAVSKASRSMQPVSIGTGTGKCNMNINRRARYADGTIYIGLNPNGVCDHNVSVVRIDDNDGNPLAVFVNWPCHATVASGRNLRITGDWPAAAARYVEEKIGNNVIVPVTAGASGDIKPLYGPAERFDYVDAIGMLVGEVVVEVAKNIETNPYGSVGVVTKTVTAKGKKTIDRSDRDFPQNFEPAEDVDINLSALRVGDILFAGISGEVMTRIGLNIKAASPLENTIVVTHCNGSSGYLCTDEAYSVGGYEVIISRTMPGTEGLIKDNMLEIIRSIDF